MTFKSAAAAAEAAWNLHGQQKLLDVEGRVDRFKKKYGSKTPAAVEAETTTPVAE